MFNIVTDSILYPERLINYRNRSGWFVFLYIMVLACFVSIASIIYSVQGHQDVNITHVTTGCTLDNGTLISTDPAHDNYEAFSIYGYMIYFFDENGSVDAVDADTTDSLIIFQGETVSIYIGNTLIMRTKVFSNLSGDEAFDSFMSNFFNMFMVGIIIAAIISNAVLLAVIALIAMIVFSRLVKFISFGKIFKMVVFATTPVAIVLVFNNLWQLPLFVFVILMAAGYRSIFILQRELYVFTMIHANQQQGGTWQNPGTPDMQGPKEENEDEKDSDDSDEDE